MRRFTATVTMLAVLIAAGCKAPVSGDPPPLPNYDRLVTFHFDMYDEGANDIPGGLPATFTITPSDATGAPTSITNNGVTTVGIQTFGDHVPAKMTIGLDETTAEVTIDVVVQLVEMGDVLHCWVERGPEYLFSTDVDFVAEVPGVLFGTCKYTVGMPAEGGGPQ